MNSPLDTALKELRAEETATLKRLATIRRAREALESLVQNGAVPEAASKPAPRRTSRRRKVKPHNTLGPRGIEAADIILRNHGEPMTVREILNEIQRRGWIREESKAPLEATRVALRRLQERGGARKLPDGRWITASTKGGDL